uniref:Uncharacterized protein n=1 Tax=Lepeophtheirus salmonis TaxID=72036 RepID=A0A0K2V4C0_LEPSM
MMVFDQFGAKGLATNRATESILTKEYNSLNDNYHCASRMGHTCPQATKSHTIKK